MFVRSNRGQRWRRPARISIWLTAVVVGVVFVACSGGGGSAGNSPGDSAPSASGTPASPGKSWAGKDPAPDFPQGVTWFNVERPLTLADLKGKVVLLDFWTLGCINCQHIIPDLKRLEAEFGDALAVVGVHSGKYAAEHDDESIREAIGKYGLHHAVVNDPDFVIWKSFGANAWPTTVLVDPAGKLVGGHAGEGIYPLFQPIVDSLVKEFEAKGQVNRAPLPLKLDATSAATVLSYPGKVLADEAGGRLFIADSGHNRVLVAGLDGALRQAIGSGKEGFADGAASEAEFRQPQGLALSADGRTLYVADTRNHAVRAVDLANGEVTTIAGTGNQLQQLPGAGAQGKKTDLASPWDLVVVGQTLYMSMAGVHQLWALDLATGEISVFAGTSREGIQDGPRRTMATLAQPSGLTTDGQSLYWVDPESSSVRMVPAAGEGDVQTIVGTGLFDYGDEDGRGKSVKLQHPQGIVFAAGGLFVADTYNHRIKTVFPLNGATRTLSGDGTRGRADGPAESASFDEPGGLGFAGDRLYVADTNNHAIRTVDIVSGVVSTLVLSNLAVATGGAGGRLTKIALPPVEAAPGVSTLRVRIAAPAGYHLNSQAPSKLSFTVGDGRVLETSETGVSWSSDEGEVNVPVPVTLREGATTLTAAGQVFYCRGGEEALCFIQQVEISLPVTVAASSTRGEVRFDYTLPPVDG